MSMNSAPSSPMAKWAAMSATAVAGIATGALAFASAVDVRTLLQHFHDDADVASKMVQYHFPVWWPNGRDFMVPVVISGVITNLWAYRAVADTRFALTAGLIGFLGPYTALVLGEDIETLRSSKSDRVEVTTRRFCWLHHVRLAVAATGFCVALSALADL